MTRLNGDVKEIPLHAHIDVCVCVRALACVRAQTHTHTRAEQDAAGLLEGLLLVTVNSPK